MDIKIFSLITYLLLFLGSVYLSIFPYGLKRWVYVALSIGWLGGIIYYALILFFSFAGHSTSSYLRVYQNVFTGGWIILILLEKLSSTKKYKEVEEGLSTCQKNLLQFLRR